MKTRMLRAGIAVVLAAYAFGATAATAGAGAVTYHDSTDVAFHIPFWEASSCTHEIVVVDGIEHAEVSWVQPATGPAHAHWLFNPYNVVGYGVVTGAPYRTTGVTGQSLSNDLVPPFVQTYISTVHLIGPGGLANVNVHLVGHATFDANGRLAATVDSWNVDCVQPAS
jgi:hypothetical protein